MPENFPQHHMSPEHNKYLNDGSYDKLQQIRYELGGKGGDGDPAFARDMRMKAMSSNTRRELSANGLFQYMHNGD